MADTAEAPDIGFAAQPWDDVASNFQQAFPDVDPEYMKKRYEQARTMASARAAYRGMGADSDFATFLQSPNPMPFTGVIADALMTRRYMNARQRVDSGNPEDADYHVVAEHEATQQAAQGASIGARVGSSLTALPALLGEGVVAGGAVSAGLGALGVGGEAATTLGRLGGFVGRQAAAAPLMPSLYAERAQQEGLPKALSVAALQNIVLGSVGRIANAAIPGEGIGAAATRLAAAGPIGVGEQQIVDALAYAGGLQSRYGLLDDYLNGAHGEALKNATVQAITFAAFAGIHETQNAAKAREASNAVLDAYHAELDRMARAGINRDTAGRRMAEAMGAIEPLMREPLQEGGIEQLLSQISNPKVRDIAERMAEVIKPPEQVEQPASQQPETPPEPPESPQPSPEQQVAKTAPEQVSTLETKPPATPQASMEEMRQIARQMRWTLKSKSRDAMEAEIRNLPAGAQLLDAVFKPLGEHPADAGPMNEFGVTSEEIKNVPQQYSDDIAELSKRTGRSEASLRRESHADVPEGGPQPPLNATGQGGPAAVGPEAAGVGTVPGDAQGNPEPNQAAPAIRGAAGGDELMPSAAQITPRQAIVERLKRGETPSLAELMNAADLTPIEKHVLIERKKEPKRSHQSITEDPEARRPDGTLYTRQRIKQIEDEGIDKLRALAKEGGIERPPVSVQEAVHEQAKADAALDMAADGKRVDLARLGADPKTTKKRRGEKLRDSAELERQLDKLFEAMKEEKTHGLLTPERLAYYAQESGAIYARIEGKNPPAPAEPAKLQDQPAEQALHPADVPEIVDQFRQALQRGDRWTAEKYMEVLDKHHDHAKTLKMLHGLYKEFGIKGSVYGAKSEGRGARGQIASMMTKGPFAEFVNEQMAKAELQHERERGLDRSEEKAVQSGQTSGLLDEEASAKGGGAAREEVGAGDNTGDADEPANARYEPTGNDPWDEPTGQPGSGSPVADDVTNVELREMVADNRLKLPAGGSGEPMFGRAGEAAADAAKWVKRKIQNAHDDIKQLGGMMFPRTQRLSEKAADAISRHVAGDVYVNEASPYLIDKVLGKKATPEQARINGAAFAEMRFRHARDAFDNKAAQLRQQAQTADPAKAKELNAVAADYGTLARNVRTFLGRENSGMESEADYQRIIHSPEFQGIISRWKSDFVPAMEKFFRMAEGMEEDSPVERMTQIPGLPFSVKAIREGDGNEGVTRTNPRQGNLKNPVLRRLGAAKNFTGSAEGYHIDLRDIIDQTMRDRVNLATKADMYRVLESEGLAQWGKRSSPVEGMREIPGVSPPRNTQAAKRGETSFYVKDQIYTEVRRALRVDEPWNKIPGTDAATRLSLMSAVEAGTHGVNLLSGAFNPGVSPTDMVRNAWGVFFKDPETMKRLVDLAEMGATKNRGFESLEGRTGVLGFTDKGGNYNPLNWIKGAIGLADRTMRLTLDNAFDRLAKQGRVIPSESNRRDFINQASGQYNKAAQNRVIALLRETGLGPFATAGSTFAASGVRALTGGPGVRATSYGHALGLRAEKIARMAVLIGAGMAYNALKWGRWDGDEKTPLGAMKIGTRPDGSSSYIDLAALTGLRRGGRMVGLNALAEGTRAGAPGKDILDRAVHQAAFGVLHPFQGPGVNFATTTLTGHNVVGTRLAPDGDTMKSLQAALMNANPVVAVATGSDRQVNAQGQRRPADFWEQLWKALGPLAPKVSSRPPGAPRSVGYMRNRYR